MEPSTFLTLDLLLLILVLFWDCHLYPAGQVQRESMVYIAGMNRIRHFFCRRHVKLTP